MSDFAQAFLPLFVAIDVFGAIPIFLSFMEGIDEGLRRRIILQAVATAFGIAVLFLLAGRGMFRLLGITADDFRIGGGLVLLVLAVTDLLFPQKARRDPGDSVGVVPLGTPLIIGPAALTTLLMINDAHGMAWTSASLSVNLAIVWAAFRFADVLCRRLGRPGLKALSKIVSLFLAAVAVMMIRLGLAGYLSMGLIAR